MALAPLGYVNGRGATGGKVVSLNPERAELMRMAFQMVAQGEPPAAGPAGPAFSI